MQLSGDFGPTLVVRLTDAATFAQYGNIAPCTSDRAPGGPFVFDRVRETTTTTGTGNVTLGGAVTGYRSFSSVLNINDTCYYVIQNPLGPEWELGIGTLVDPVTLARTTTLASTNGGALVSLPGGSKDVWIDAPKVLLDSLKASATGVTAGSYTLANITVGADGRITSASNGTYTIPSTGVVPGSYTIASITVGADGRLTAASNGTAGFSDPTTNEGDMILHTGGVTTRMPVGPNISVLASNGVDPQYVTKLDCGRWS